MSARVCDVRTGPREGQSGSCGLRSPRIASEFETLPPAILEKGLPDLSPLRRGAFAYILREYREGTCVEWEA